MKKVGREKIGLVWQKTMMCRTRKLSPAQAAHFSQGSLRLAQDLEHLGGHPWKRSGGAPGHALQ